jgi:Na+/H+ antiporter NhaD/arsenite permease-like protein
VNPLTPSLALPGVVLGAALPVAVQEASAGPVSTTGPVSQIIVALVIVALFVLLAREAAHRVLVAMACAAVLWLVTYLTPWHLISFDGAVRALDMNVIMLLAGMMAVVGVLRSTGAFEWAVARLLVRARGRPRLAARLITWFTGITSAFLDNVTTVIFVTPMAVGLSRKMRLAPVALLLPMVVASNIGGTATLIGDPPNVMIGSGAHLSFLDFIVNLTAPVLVMMVAMQAYISWYYRDAYAEAAAGHVPDEPVEEVALADPALFRWMMAICAGILVGFLTHSLTETPVAVPAVIGAACALLVQDRMYVRTHRPTAHERAHGVLEVIEKDIEWPTLSFFVFLFIIVGAAVDTGLIHSIARGMAWSISTVHTGLGLTDEGTLVFAAVFICVLSAILSAFVDNIPYVAVSIPIIHQLIPTLSGETTVLWWALALGACLGGNATVVGASANVTTVGLAEKDGVRIGFREYSRFAAPIATLTILISSAYLAAVVYLGGDRAQAITWVLALVLIGLEVALGWRRPAEARAG